MSVEEKAKQEAHKIIVDELKAKLADGYWEPNTEADDAVTFRRNLFANRIAALLQQKETQNKNLQEQFDEAAKINKEYQSTIKEQEADNFSLREDFERAYSEKTIAEGKLAESQSTISRLEGELKEYEERLTELEEEQRCSECKCATPGEAESKECGCDAPVCAIERPDTLATAFEKQFAELTRLREAMEKIAVRTKELRNGQRGMCDAEWDHIQGLAEGRYNE